MLFFKNKTDGLTDGHMDDLTVTLCGVKNEIYFLPPHCVVIRGGNVYGSK